MLLKIWAAKIRSSFHKVMCLASANSHPLRTDQNMGKKDNGGERGKKKKMGNGR